MHNAKFHPIYVEDNYNKEAMQCEKCLKPYGSLYQLCEHLKKFHFNVKPKCMFCDEIFEVRKELSEHIKSFHAEEHKKRFKNLKNQEKLPCEQCGKMISKRFMHSHLRSHKEYVCDKCGKSFNFQAKLRYHIEDAHEEGHFVCDECGKVCSSQKKLKAHQKYHKEVKVPTRCTFPGCKLISPSMSSMKAHLRKAHKPAHEKVTYPCKYCPKIYTSKLIRDQHERGIHLGFKDFKCDKCDASYEFSSALSDHKKTQHSGIMYSCDYPGCDKSYNAKGNLDAHRKRVHKIARPKEYLN